MAGKAGEYAAAAMGWGTGPSDRNALAKPPGPTKAQESPVIITVKGAFVDPNSLSYLLSHGIKNAGKNTSI